nr:MAG TPA: hypothetical protein [Caudoviricetes sp.]DAT16126.1 MAG TPA: hypothetical protein [Caudoviricetes sp.]
MYSTSSNGGIGANASLILPATGRQSEQAPIR